MTRLSFRPGRAVPLVLSTFAVAAFTAASTVILPAQEGLPPARAIIDGARVRSWSRTTSPLVFPPP